MRRFNRYMHQKMLRLIKTKRHSTKHLQRLWFNDQNHDLFIWLENNIKPVKFQFSYNKMQNEHSLNWDLLSGYSHVKIDSGEDVIHTYKMTPIMVPDGTFDQNQLAWLFKSINNDLPPDLAEFIQQKIESAPSGI